MGGLDSSHNNPDGWKEGDELSEGYEERCRAEIQRRIDKVFGRNSFELMTTPHRYLRAILVESGVFDDEQFIGEDSGGFVHKGKCYYSQEGLAQVANLKMLSGLTDEEIDGIIIQVTLEGAYVVWSEIEPYISQINKTENGGGE